jgi:hypothetical protein
MCTTAAPNLGWPLMSEPSVYTHSAGASFGIQGMGVGGVTALVVWLCPGGHFVGSAGASSRLGRGWENVHVFVGGIYGISSSWVC